MLADLTKLQEIYGSLQVKSSALERDLSHLRDDLSKESLLREKNEDELKSQLLVVTRALHKITQERSTEKKLTLIRGIGAALQFSMTEQFPGLFTSKFKYATTFKDLSDKIAKTNDPNHQRAYSLLLGRFQAAGIVDIAGIGPLIKVVRELGTNFSHPTMMSSAEGGDYFPSVVEIAQWIDELSTKLIPTPLTKEDIKALLKVLEEIHPPGLPLLATQKSANDSIPRLLCLTSDS